MKRILLTGMSGTGKSTVIAALGDLGYKAVDADYGWCTSAPDGEWLWHEQRVDELLATEDADVLFFAGCASNQGKFRHRFDHIVLLSAPLEVMLERVRTRTTNPFGTNTDERDRILDDHANIEPLLRAASSLEINTARARSPTWSRTSFASPAEQRPMAVPRLGRESSRRPNGDHGALAAPWNRSVTGRSAMVLSPPNSECR